MNWPAAPMPASCASTHMPTAPSRLFTCSAGRRNLFSGRVDREGFMRGLLPRELRSSVESTLAQVLTVRSIRNDMDKTLANGLDIVRIDKFGRVARYLSHSAERACHDWCPDTHGFQDR